MIPSQVRRELEDTVIQWMWMRSMLLTGKRKESSSPRDGCFKCGGTIFRETAMYTKPHAKAMAMARRTNGATHGPKSVGKEKSRVRETETTRKIQIFQECQRLLQEEKLDTCLSGPENPKSKTGQETQESAQTCPTDNSCTENSWFDDGSS